MHSFTRSISNLQSPIFHFNIKPPSPLRFISGASTSYTFIILGLCLCFSWKRVDQPNSSVHTIPYLSTKIPKCHQSLLRSSHSLPHSLFRLLFARNPIRTKCKQANPIAVAVAVATTHTLRREIHLILPYFHTSILRTALHCTALRLPTFDSSPFHTFINSIPPSRQ